MLSLDIFRRRDLPHWDVPGATYFVTSCLEGSIPARGLLDIQQYDRSLQARKPHPGITVADWNNRRWKLTFDRIDCWLDQEPAVRHLSDPALAGIVMNTLLHFAVVRYDVLAFVVMPSHFHWAFRPSDDWVQSLDGTRSPRERIMQSVKGYSASQCNRHRGCQGTFWQEESYDHWVRDADELERIIHYIENNPVRASLVESPDQWQFSSAWLRREQGLLFGVPLHQCEGRPPGLPINADRPGGLSPREE